MSCCRDQFPAPKVAPLSDLRAAGPSAGPATVTSPSPGAAPSDITADLGTRIRRDFPILNQLPPPGRPALAFLDTAASSQKPDVVIDAVSHYHRTTNANIHRGVYALSEHATAQYEAARATIAAFIGAADPREVVFTRNTTESINLVANAWGRKNLRPGDLVVLTVMEHHSNLVPWQLIAEQTGAELAFVPMLPGTGGRLDLDAFDALLARSPKLVAFSHVSNALGTIHPAAEITRRAKAAGATVLIDGAQSVPHLPVNVAELGCDFLAFSGHKLFGPTGIGVLWGRREILDAMPPFLGGGSMIRRVELTGSTWADVPARFEAGTPAIAEAIGLGVAVEYVSGIGLDAIRQHEHDLLVYALARLAEVPHVTVFGPANPDEQAGVISFVVDDVHPHDVAAILDEGGVAVRAGHHCCQPLMRELDLIATTRASFGPYTTTADIDALVAGLHRVNAIFNPI
ncbi:MAG TPA: cysteine desulfurase [Thermomicrobiales bacterium]|jgi:cysteine desulfurase/selenocysteine lyase|nr:cysteine desulfurase [Thermomicrobiales bacterium]